MTPDPTPLAEDMLSAYLDGELGDVDRHRVERLVATDPMYAAVLEDVRIARDALRALPARAVPVDTWDRILDSVNRADVEAASPPDIGPDTRAAGLPTGVAHLDDRRVHRVGRWVAAGAAAAAALALFVVPGRSSSDSTPPLDDISDNAAVAQTGASDPVTGLVPVGVQAGLSP